MGGASVHEPEVAGDYIFNFRYITNDVFHKPKVAEDFIFATKAYIFIMRGILQFEKTSHLMTMSPFVVILNTLILDNSEQRISVSATNSKWII